MRVRREALEVLSRERLGSLEILLLAQGFDLEQQGLAIEEADDPRAFVAVERCERASAVLGCERLACCIDLPHFTR